MRWWEKWGSLRVGLTCIGTVCVKERIKVHKEQCTMLTTDIMHGIHHMYRAIKIINHSHLRSSACTVSSKFVIRVSMT